VDLWYETNQFHLSFPGPGARSIFATSAPSTSGYWQSLASGAQAGANTAGVGANLKFKYSPVSTEAGQILEQVKFLEWLLSLQSKPYDLFDILIISMAAAPEGADGVTRDKINLRFSQVVHALQSLCTISFIDQRVNLHPDQYDNDITVGLFAGDAKGNTEQAAEVFIDNWNARMMALPQVHPFVANIDKTSDKICSDRQRVLFVTTDLPENSNLEKKFQAISNGFGSKHLRCRVGVGFNTEYATVTPVLLGNVNAAEAKMKDTLSLAVNQGHVVTIFVAVGELIQPTINAIKAGAWSPYMRAQIGIITIEPLAPNSEQLTYASPPRGAHVAYSVSAIGRNAMSSAKYFFDECPGFVDCPASEKYGNNGDTITTAHPPYKAGGVPTFTVKMNYWNGTANCTDDPVSTDVFTFKNPHACHTKTSTVGVKDVGDVKSLTYSGTSCTSGGTVELYTDTKCVNAYHATASVKHNTSGEWDAFCVANGADSQKLTCTGYSDVAAPVAPAPSSGSSGSDGLSKGASVGIGFGIAIGLLVSLWGARHWWRKARKPSESDGMQGSNIELNTLGLRGEAHDARGDHIILF